AARCTAVVVLPTPPFCAATAMTVARWLPVATAGPLTSRRRSLIALTTFTTSSLTTSWRRPCRGVDYDAMCHPVKKTTSTVIHGVPRLDSGRTGSPPQESDTSETGSPDF